MSENDSNENTTNKLCIELTYYSDSIPSIKSYYFMSSEEYEELENMHIDLYIEDFMNGEDLTKEKLDIYLINNPKNILVIEEFLRLYGNPFDILSYIKTLSEQISEPIMKPKKTYEINSESETETDSEDSIDVMTEIINNFNKTKTFDKEQLNKYPNLLNDNIINEINEATK